MVNLNKHKTFLSMFENLFEFRDTSGCVNVSLYTSCIYTVLDLDLYISYIRSDSDQFNVALHFTSI